MEAQREQEPAVVLCVFSDNVATWHIQHSRDTDGETFESIFFDDDQVRLYTDDGRELVIPEEAYLSFGEAISCEMHMIQELDSFGNLTREYQVNAPVVSQAPAFGG